MAAAACGSCVSQMPRLVRLEPTVMRYVRVAGIITCEFSTARGDWIRGGVVRISVVSSDKSPLANLPKITWNHKRDGHCCPFTSFMGFHLRLVGGR